MPKMLLILAALLFIHRCELLAQEGVTVVTGEKARVWLSGNDKKELSGNLLALDADTLVLRANSGDTLSLPVNSVAKMEIVTGKKRFGILKGALLGFITGAATGALIGYNVDVSEDCEFCEGFYAAFYALTLGSTGVLAGSFAGAVIRKDQWQKVPPNMIQLQPVKKEPGPRLPPPAGRPQSIYFEMFGSGFFYSLNYDRMFSNSVGGRIGVMYFPAGSQNETHFMLPIMVNYLVGASSHKMEMSAGLLAILSSTEIGDVYGSGQGAGVIGTLFYGYRYQPQNRGFLFRIGLTPMFSKRRTLLWGGMSLGMNF